VGAGAGAGAGSAGGGAGSAGAGAGAAAGAGGADGVELWLHPIRSTVAVDNSIILNALAFMVVPRVIGSNATRRVALAASKRTHETDRETKPAGGFVSM